jgi:hypothetical protein
VHCVHLVGTDVLGDATGLAGLNIRVANRVKQTGLTVVDVTHDGDDRRTSLELILVILVEVGRDVETEAFEQLALFVFWRNDLDLVAELLAQNLEGIFVERSGCGCHLTEVEQNGDQLTCIGVNLVGKVLNARTATQTDDGRAVSAWHNCATQRRSLSLLVLFAFRTLRLASLARTASTALTEGTCGTAADAATATTGWAATWAVEATGACASARSATAEAWASAAGTGRTWAKAWARCAAGTSRTTWTTWATCAAGTSRTTWTTRATHALR